MNYLVSIFGIAVTVFLLIIAGGCKNISEETVKGKMYYYYDDSSKLIAFFNNDTLYYVLRTKSPVSPLEVPIAHKSKYTIRKVDDSTFTVELENKPRFWEKATWDIVIRDPSTIVSVESGKVYNETKDKSLLKK